MVYKWCAVPCCTNTSVKTPKILFLCVPKDPKMRNKWLELAHRDPNDIKGNSSIFFCEDHFQIEKDILIYKPYKMGLAQRILLADGVLPSKFHCQTDHERILNDAGTSRAARTKRQKTKHECKEDAGFSRANVTGTSKQDMELPAKTGVLKSIALLLKNCPPPRVRKPPPLVRKRPKKILAIDGVSRIPEFNTACVESSLFAVSRLDRELRLLPLHDGCVHAEREEVGDAPRLSSRSRLDGAWLESILSSDEALAAACGIRSHSTLDEIVVDLLQHYPEQLSDPRESIILTTMKLRTDLSFAALAELFGYGDARACRRIFVRTLRSLAIALRPALRWSPGQREDAPESFRGFETTAIALSHVWLALRCPKCPDCRAKTWCPAKRRFVAKFIAGVTPKGTFIYASELLAAETSDSVVFERSDLVRRVDRGCAIMFNVGFSGIDGICKKYGIRIYAHLNSGDKKLSTQEISFNRRIADARAHVNRAIRRIRRFAILKSTISWTLVPQLQDVVAVCCALANLERSNEATNIKKPS